ncbi:MAG TPA: DUF3443 domain-containing protein [Paraburkholderia sp.]
MNALKKTLAFATAIVVIALSACGGGSSSGTGNSQGGNSIGWNATPDWTPSGSNGSGNSNNSGNPALPATGGNTVPIYVDSTMGAPNQPYVSIKVCAPGTPNQSQCVTVNNMLVDTGSTGVRIAARAIPTLAPLLLSQVGAVDDKTGAAPIAQCAPFVSGYLWGSIKRADVTIGSKTASNIPIQVYSDGAFPTPDDCIKQNATNLDDPSTPGMNGIIGIDNFTRDSADALTTAVTGLYYYCPLGTPCVSTRMLAGKEVMNPVAAFATDNNGTVIRLPAVPAGGQASVTGQLVFGVSTQQNNVLPASATVLAIDKYGSFTTQYHGQAFTLSAIDSGTNGYVFPDDTIPNSGNGSWYIPTSTLNLTATMESANGTGTPFQMPFSIANAYSLVATGYSAFSNLGAYLTSHEQLNMFLWGLPFFYGRDVYTVIGTAKVGKQTGPFVAF